MRYIAKSNNSDAFVLLEKAKQEMRNAGISCLYNHFNEKENLNNILRREQKQICCYCQQRIEHYQGISLTGSHNEHFFPETHFEKKQLDNDNIFACCNRTKGYEKRFQYCGEYKADNIIEVNLLLDEECSRYFKYNVNGEILPNSSIYNSYDEFIQHRELLTSDQSKALSMIEGLNLNEKDLKFRRKNIISDLFESAKFLSTHKIQHKILVLHNEQERYIEFVDLVIYYLHIILNLKNKNNS